MPDFVDELVSKRTKKNRDFPRLVAEASERRVLGRLFVAHREKLGLTQTEVAVQMKTSASVVSKLENGADVSLSTFQRYLTTIGMSLSSCMTSDPKVKIKEAPEEPKGKPLVHKGKPVVSEGKPVVLHMNNDKEGKYR